MSTPNFALSLPAHGSQNWDTPLNNNFTALDTALGGGTQGQIWMSNGPGTAPSKRTIVNNEVPTGAINGTNGSDGNAAFTIANAPFVNFKLTKNGVEMYSGVAFNIVGNAITFLAPYIPITGDLIRASYIF